MRLSARREYRTGGGERAQALGQDPVCIVRNADKAREVLGADAKTAVAELTDRPALEKALAGVHSVFVVTGHNPGMVEQQNNVLDAALKAGAQYLVRVGGGRAVARPIRNRWWAAATPPSRSGSRQAASNG